MSEKVKVVVVEDDEILLKALNVVLLQKGYEVVSASDGEAGEKLIKESKPHCVLLDVMLPKKTGFEVLEALRKDEATKDIPVIILSNLGQESDVEKGMSLGAQDYFIKSNTDVESVTEKVEQHLKK